MSHEEVLDYFSRGFSIQEIGDNISNLSRLELPTRKSIYNKHCCCECGGDLIHIEKGVKLCKVCFVEEYEMVPGFIEEIWRYQKTSNSRRRWFVNKVGEFTDRRHVRTLADDFVRVTSALEARGMIGGKGSGRNVSRYEYYIIRLCSRRAIKLKKTPKDVKTPEIRSRLDDELFGAIYPILGWDNDCACSYYLNWLGRSERHITPYTLVYFGSGWDIKPVTNHIYRKFNNYIFIDSLPDPPHYKPNTYGYERCKNRRSLIKTLTEGTKRVGLRRTSIRKNLLTFKNDKIKLEYYINTTVQEALKIRHIRKKLDRAIWIHVSGFNPYLHGLKTGDLKGALECRADIDQL